MIDGISLTGAVGIHAAGRLRNARLRPQKHAARQCATDRVGPFQEIDLARLAVLVAAANPHGVLRDRIGEVELGSRRCLGCYSPEDVEPISNRTQAMQLRM
jgi:hypothetical protein